MFADIDFVTAQQAAAKCPRCMALLMDVTDTEQIEKGIAHIVKEFGRLDILVNNAGVNSMKHRVNIDQFPPEEWEWIMKVDLNGVFLVSRLAARVMIRQKYGRIVNISSVLGVVPARLQCAFVAAKAGVVHLTRAIAIELAPNGILVNCIAPGSMENFDVYEKGSPFREFARRLLKHVPMGRPGKLEAIAYAALYFASQENSYATGQTLCVDGGWTAGGFFRDF